MSIVPGAEESRVAGAGLMNFRVAAKRLLGGSRDAVAPSQFAPGSQRLKRQYSQMSFAGFMRARRGRVRRALPARAPSAVVAGRTAKQLPRQRAMPQHPRRGKSGVRQASLSGIPSGVSRPSTRAGAPLVAHAAESKGSRSCRNLFGRRVALEERRGAAQTSAA